MENIGRVPVGALSNFKRTFSKEICAGGFGNRTLAPKIAVERGFDLEPDVNVIRIANRLRRDMSDFADVESHQLDGVAHFQTSGAIDKSEIGGLGFEPAFAFGGGIDVINKPNNQQTGGQQNKKTDRALHSAEARA